MTQNNERELLVKIKYAICMAIYSDDGLDGLEGENLMKEIDKYLSPISQNEQQEVIGFIDEADDGIFGDVQNGIAEGLCKVGDLLYTSPPKQIPDGWISVDIRLPSAMQEVLLTNSDGYFVHGKPLFHNSTGEFNCWIYTLYSQDVLDFITQYRPTHWMPLPEAPTTSLTSETNTEVGK